MSTILAYTTPAKGHLYPLTSILLELQARGHDIRVRTLASEVQTMRGLGFGAEAIDARVAAIELQDWKHRSPQKALAASVSTFVARAEFDATDLRTAIAQEQPAAVLVDINSWGGLAAAEKWGGPWAAFCPYPIPLPSPDATPVRSGSRSRTRLQRTRQGRGPAAAGRGHDEPEHASRGESGARCIGSG